WARTSMPSSWFAQAQTITAMAEPDAVHFAAHVATQFTYGAHTTNVGGQQAAVVGRIGELSTGMTAFPPVKDEVMLWPNPAHDAINLELNGARAQNARLLNSAGQQVRTMRLNPGRNSLDARGLQTGLYLLKLEDGRAARVVVE
ncbi:MAG TPA: T9SS type A sorting domain-containing protein, partial [Flavobacteriales bacterium]|nr:T9SS type A sorting domain-containing protein [Flavobacteriales bacterium]